MKNDKNIKVFQSEKRVGLREITVFHGLEPTGKMNKAKGVGLLYPGAKVDPFDILLLQDPSLNWDTILRLLISLLISLLRMVSVRKMCSTTRPGRTSNAGLLLATVWEASWHVRMRMIIRKS